MLALRMPWPLPALMAWAGAWLIFVALQRAAVPPVGALLVACLLGTAASVLGGSWWRRGLIAAGFPLSLALLGAASLLWVSIRALCVRLDEPKGMEITALEAPMPIWFLVKV